jgi:DNA polymerase III alpha subunit (gram-positive type)
MIQIPMQWVALALSFIKEDKVDQWVAGQANWLAMQVYGENDQPAPHLPTDDYLWAEFTVAFRRQFQDTAEHERAWADLQKLSMKDQNIDQYIADFENLLALAGRNRNKAMALKFFKFGLKAGLHNTILNRQPIPRTLDQWQSMVREEVEIQTLKQASLGSKPKFWMTSQDSLWQNHATAQTKKKQRDSDAMDIDAIRTNKLSAAERTSLMKEGKCFVCKKAGHMARACPDKLKGKDKRKESMSKVIRTSKIEEVEEEKKASSSKEVEEPLPNYPDKDGIKAAIRRMKAKEWETLIESLALNEDF